MITMKLAIVHIKSNGGVVCLQVVDGNQQAEEAIKKLKAGGYKEIYAQAMLDLDCDV